MINRHWIFLLCCLFISCSKPDTNKKNEWIKQNGEYEEGVFTLEIKTNMNFSITIYSIYYQKIVGKIEGKLNLIKPVSKPHLNVYYAVFKDYIGEFDSRKENGIMVLVEKDNNIIVNVFGDNINSGTGYYPYDGLYIKNEPLNEEEEKKLKLLFMDIYDIGEVKILLGLNVKYFLEVFESYKIERTNEKIIIKGWMPGGNSRTNGIIKIENKYIYILYGDNRYSGQYIYITNDKSANELPKDFFEWEHFPKIENIQVK